MNTLWELFLYYIRNEWKDYLIQQYQLIRTNISCFLKIYSHFVLLRTLLFLKFKFPLTCGRLVQSLAKNYQLDNSLSGEDNLLRGRPILNFIRCRL